MLVVGAEAGATADWSTASAYATTPSAMSSASRERCSDRGAMRAASARNVVTRSLSGAEGERQEYFATRCLLVRPASL